MDAFKVAVESYFVARTLPTGDWADSKVDPVWACTGNFTAGATVAILLKF